ncbi:hypothetical protein BDR22DRAFT_823377 [Usnea florida]
MLLRLNVVEGKQAKLGRLDGRARQAYTKPKVLISIGVLLGHTVLQLTVNTAFTKNSSNGQRAFQNQILNTAIKDVELSNLELSQQDLSGSRASRADQKLSCPPLSSLEWYTLDAHIANPSSQVRARKNKLRQAKRARAEKEGA